MVEMKVRYYVTRDIQEEVVGEFAGVELGPLPSLFLPLRVEDKWKFISFSAIIDIECDTLPEEFVVTVDKMLETVNMHRQMYETEKTRFDKVSKMDEPDFTDANWGHG
tara:strand:- start:10757 stop:11080 length:324 start_codon:yes stop_codon:yes gene_type:complete